MGEENAGRSGEAEQEETLQSGETALPASEEVSVEYQPAAPGLPEGKTIHPRRPIPEVPKGDEAPDEHPSPPAEIEEP